MHILRRFGPAALLAAAAVINSSAQSVTSAHSGTVHYFEGAVTVDHVALVSKVGKFTEMKENGVLQTERGRAEILLTPGVFLRVGENSEVKLLDNRLMSTRVELVSGTAVVESDDPEVSIKDPAVTIVYKNFEILPVKYGVFEISTSPAEVKVFKGQASVVAGENRTVVKDGHLLPFSAALLTEKFDARQADDLYLWTRDRSAALSAANMSAARTLASQGGYTGRSFLGSSTGNWYYNQGMGMFTYMPFGAGGYNSFGYGFYSPGSIYDGYNPYGYYWYGGGGSRTGGSAGTPVATPTAQGVQSARLGSVHPTLGSPVRSVAFDGSPIGNRGGFNAGLAGNQTNTIAQSSGFDAGSTGRSISASSNVAASSTGRSSGGGAVSAPAAASSARGR